MTIAIMGVSGSGKSTIARLLAETLSWQMIEADDLHSSENVAKMRAGEPLNDVDREGWLTHLQQRIWQETSSGASIVVACSALRRVFRQRLAAGAGGPTIVVFLQVDLATAFSRVRNRENHFMPSSLVSSQFESLEVPGAEEALIVSADLPASELVTQVLERLRGVNSAQPFLGDISPRS
jgi:gluconokinase